MVDDQIETKTEISRKGWTGELKSQRFKLLQEEQVNNYGNSIKMILIIFTNSLLYGMSKYYVSLAHLVL